MSRIVSIRTIVRVVAIWTICLSCSNAKGMYSSSKYRSGSLKGQGLTKSCPRRSFGVQAIGTESLHEINSAAQMCEPAILLGSISYSAILNKSVKRAIGGGASGALAGVLQVLTLMWLRTTMNYQYRYGTTTSEALKTLWKQGGIRRFYRGLGFALVQNPISRFGDTAANTGILALFDEIPEFRSLPLPVKQAFASLAASSWRIAITPIDTFKTTLQVEGQSAVDQLKEKVKIGGVGVLWNGALAASVATFVGNYPWFLTFNALDQSLPPVDEGDVLGSLLRRAFIGVVASAVSDTCSNSLRVIKTAKQTSKVPKSYVAVTNEILEKDGITGLLGRGLQTRLLVNCLQGSLFSVLWKYFEKELNVR